MPASFIKTINSVGQGQLTQQLSEELGDLVKAIQMYGGAAP